MSPGEGYRPEFFAQMSKAEQGHFWFRGRAALIVWALRTYQPRLRSFLDIGCGTGYNLARIAQAFPEASLCGSERMAGGLRFAAEACPSAELVQMDARRIPFVERFDAIGAFDVLEHVEDDTRVLDAMYAALCPGGIIVLTVPQHMWLWSGVDRHSCHVRRYARGELQEKARAAGFAVLRSTSFVFLALPAMLASRLLRRGETGASAELALPGALDRLFGGMLGLERAAIAAGVDLPIGGSRLVVARKPGRDGSGR